MFLYILIFKFWVANWKTKDFTAAPKKLHIKKNCVM